MKTQAARLAALVSLGQTLGHILNANASLPLPNSQTQVAIPTIPKPPDNSPLERQNSQDSLRIRSFTEFMTPALNSTQNQIPNPSGEPYIPTNIYNIVWADYAIGSETKILYWQRWLVNFADGYYGPAITTVPRNPRFALRKTNVFPIPHLSTTYDIYIQPGVAPEAATEGRDLEFGIRTSHSYEFPKSRWSVGLVTELTASLTDRDIRTGADSYGWMMAWGSYELNSIFSTQHFFTLNIEHVRGTSGLSWDSPLPFVQNGIGIQISQSIWSAVFLNTYLIALPTVSNTWISVWLSLNIL
jgi:hypothetical protein